MMVPWAKIAEAAQGVANSSTQLGAGIATSQSFANRQQRKLLKSDVDAMKRGQLGLSDAQQNQMAANAMQAAQAAQAPQIEAAQRMAAANPSTASTAYTTLGQMAANSASAGAQARSAASTQSAAQAAARRSEIIGRVSARAAENTANGKHYGQVAGQMMSGTTKAAGDASSAKYKKNKGQVYAEGFEGQEAASKVSGASSAAGGGFNGFKF